MFVSYFILQEENKLKINKQFRPSKLEFNSLSDAWKLKLQPSEVVSHMIDTLKR